MMFLHWASGYYVAVVIVEGPLTWPLAARVLLALLTNVILAYEFVFNPVKERHQSYAMRRVVGVSVIPFILGIVCVIVLFVL